MAFSEIANFMLCLPRKCVSKAWFRTANYSSRSRRESFTAAAGNIPVTINIDTFCYKIEIRPFTCCDMRVNEIVKSASPLPSCLRPCAEGLLTR